MRENSSRVAKRDLWGPKSENLLYVSNYYFYFCGVSNPLIAEVLGHSVNMVGCQLYLSWQWESYALENCLQFDEKQCILVQVAHH